MLRLTVVPGHTSGCQDAAGPRGRHLPGKFGLLVPAASQMQLLLDVEFKHKGYGTMAQGRN